MSKSKGNVIDPLELINNFGADSLRFTLISMASPGRDVKLSKDRVIGNRNFITKIWSANNFLNLNKCKLIKKVNLKNIKLPVNQWIYNEYEKTLSEATKQIENFRFDEASRVIYKFVWHYYCDWYLEFLKPIFISKNKLKIDEAKIFSSYMMSNILKILHPFIPFFTESLWQKNKYNKFFNTPLIQAEWSKADKNVKFNKYHRDIFDVIEIISNIRSAKAELNITPKLSCDIIFTDKSKTINKLINSNIEIIKQVGRVDKLVVQQNNIKNTIDILVLKEKLTLKFNEDVNISSQKNKILEKIKNLENKIQNLVNKLNNKAYLKNAPNNIVQNDRHLLTDLTIEEKKLRSIVSSII